MTESSLSKQLVGIYGLYMYAHEVAEVTRKSKSRIGKWLYENQVDYFADGVSKKYYTPDVAKAIVRHRVAGYAKNITTTPSGKPRKVLINMPAPVNNVIHLKREAAL